MTKLVNTFKAGAAALTQKSSAGYRNKMGQAVNFVEMFQRHGLSAQEIENFSVGSQQEYE